MTLYLILGLMLLGVIVTYVISTVNEKAGGYMTVLVSLVGLVTVFMIKDQIGSFESISLLNFKITTVGWYFAMVMLVTYFTTSFFNPFWMDRLIYPRAYNLLYVLSLASTIGLFFARDLITLFIFWELVVWSSTFIIQMGKSRRASYVYYVLSAIGSMVSLYSIMLTYNHAGTLEIATAFQSLASDPSLALLVFSTFMFAGLTKIGIFPFHVWLPLAHGSAPHTFSPVLSGGLVKMGAYIAFLGVTVFPAYQAFANSITVMGVPLPIYVLMVLGAISIVIGTLFAIKSDDAKKLLAYSSVANGGYILIAILLNDQMGLAGGLMHLMNHALASAAAFLTIAAVAYRTGTTKISELGGMIHRMPVTYTVYLIAIISMAGIPPMGGFVSKWLILQGLSNRGLIFMAGAAAFGSIGSYLYVFRPLAAVFLGQLAPKHEKVKEVNIFMQIPMVILTALTLLFGVFPKYVLTTINQVLFDSGVTQVALDGNTILSTNGFVNMYRVFVVFGFGFVMVLVLFLLLPKSRRVGLMDTYTSAEFIHTPELYHYGNSFYAPFERLYAKLPDVLPLYERGSRKIKELGLFFETLFYGHIPGKALFWILAVGILFYVGGGY